MGIVSTANDALAVRPREAITWLRENPNARGRCPNSRRDCRFNCCSQFANAGVRVHAGDRIGDSTLFGPDAAFNPEIKALDSVRSAVTLTEVRRRGPKPIKLEKTKEKMRRDIQEGRQTADALKNMFEKDLASSYGVSRDTARRARNAVLSELSNIRFRQITPTTDSDTILVIVHPSLRHQDDRILTIVHALPPVMRGTSLWVCKQG